MNNLTTRQLFQMANLELSDDFIKCLLSFTGANGFNKVKDFDIDKCISSGYVSLTTNNYLLLCLDRDNMDFFGNYYFSKFSNASGIFKYDNLCIKIDGIFGKNVVSKLDNIFEIVSGYSATIMICGNTDKITKKHVDDIKNMYYDDGPVYSYKTKESFRFEDGLETTKKYKNYELVCNIDKEIFNIEKYTLPTEPVENIYFDFSKGVLFNIEASKEMSELNEVIANFQSLMNNKHLFCKTEELETKCINNIKQEIKKFSYLEISEII